MGTKVHCVLPLLIDGLVYVIRLSFPTRRYAPKTKVVPKPPLNWLFREQTASVIACGIITGLREAASTASARACKVEISFFPNRP